MERRAPSPWFWLILALGAAVRLVPLGWQSLWFDEVFTFNTSSGSLSHLWSELIRDAQHPPLHYLVEWAMLRLGSSEFVLRLPSALSGVATLVLVYRIGRAVFGVRSALVGAALVALSPFQVHLSHEARDFEMYCALAALSSWLLLEAMSGRQRWPAYALAVVAGAFTSNLMAATLAAHGLFVFGSRRRESVGAWLTAATVCAITFGGWLCAMRLGNPHLGERLLPGRGSLDNANLALLGALMDFSLGYFRGLGVGIVSSSPLLQGTVMLGVMLAVAFVMFGLAQASKENRCFLALNLAAPLALGFYLAYATQFNKPRYFLGAYPAFALLLAGGAESALRKHRAMALPLALVVALNAVALRNYLMLPQYQRDDFRGLARYFEQQLRPGDYLVFNAGWEDQTLDHYFKRPYAREGIPRGAATPSRHRPEEHQRDIEREVQRVVDRWPRVWLVLCYDEVTDPDGWVKRAFDRKAKLMGQRRFAGWPQLVRVYLYESPAPH